MAYRRQFWWDDGQFTGEDGEPIRAFEVTPRVVDGCHILAPDDQDLVALQWGVLGKALQKYRCELYAVHILSNHASYLVGCYDQETYIRFKQFVNGNWAKETNNRRNRTGSLQARRSTGIPIGSDAALLDRLAYNLGNGTVEGLVATPEDWPGVHAAAALLTPERTVTGIWIDRAQFWADGGPDKVDLADYEEEVTIKFSKLPTHRDLSDDEYVLLVREMCDAAVETWKQKDRGEPLGKAAVSCVGAWKRRTPYKDRVGCSHLELSTEAQRKRRGVRTPAPPIHAECPKIRHSYITAYWDHAELMIAHREALAELLAEIVPGEALCPERLAPMLGNFPRPSG